VAGLKEERQELKNGIKQLQGQMAQVVSEETLELRVWGGEERIREVQKTFSQLHLM
jgi:hypothetical protein